MSKFSSHIIALLLLALLSACQSLPDPDAEVVSEAEASANANEVGQDNEVEPVAEVIAETMAEVEPQVNPSRSMLLSKSTCWPSRR